MGRLTTLLGIVLVALIAESTCKRIPQLILHRGPVVHPPIYRAPARRGVPLRTVREVKEQEPLWLYQDENIDRAPSTGDYPMFIDDIMLDQNRRTARSVDNHSAKQGGGSSRGSSSSSDTGPTHPGFNRRNARSARSQPIFDPISPSDTFPRPRPFPRPHSSGPRILPRPIYARTVREVNIPDVVKKPTHRNVVIPHWNPNARIKPWHRHIGINLRRPRSVEELSEFSNAVDYEE